MSELPDDGHAAPAEDHDDLVASLADLVVQRGALKFGRFNLRPNKASPYNLDVAALCRGRDTFELGRILAKTLEHHFDEAVDLVFGASPKGSVLAATAAFYYAHIANLNTEWGFNGTTAPEGGQLGEGRRVVILDDVLASGETMREAIETVRARGATVLGCLVLVDRRERTKSNRIAANEIERDTGIKVVSCATISELVKKMPLPDEKRELIVKHVTIEGGPVPPRFTP